jgi:hypothetical protein
MAILRKVAFAMLVAMIFYPFIHLVKGGLNQDDVHSLGAFLSVVGAIYGVLAAFVIFVVWEQYNTVEKVTIQEASLGEDLYRLSRYFNDDLFDQKKRFAKSVKEYLLACVDEWNDLGRGNESEKAVAALNGIETRLRDFQPSSQAGDGVIYENLLDTLKKFYECRDERIATAKHRMPRTLLYVLILLSAILILGFCMLPIHSTFLGTFVVTGMVGILLSIFEVVTDMDNPFQGVWNVSSEPFAEQAKKIP